MSFILDALKKSERERERQQQPAVVEVAYGQRSRRQPVWLMIVVALLVINCVLLLLMWWRSGSTPSAATPVAITVTPTVATPVPASASSTHSAASVSAAARPSEVRPLLDEASEPEPVDETATTLADATPPAGPPLVRPSTGLERAMAQQDAQANSARLDSLSRNTFGSSTPAPRVTNDNTPTLESMGGSGALGLPGIRLDVHVYSAVATERFAFINSHKYQEGQVLSEGPTLERITQDGVVLNYRGQRFLVPRQ